MSPAVPPRVAVLLAACNGIAWLPEQVRSIFLQRDVELILFVSVDISTDGTEAWFDDLAAVESRVVILPHGQYFGGAAANFFRLIRDVDFSSFEYVCFSDQDDIWFRHKLIRAIEQLCLHDAQGYSCNVDAWWASGRTKLLSKSQPQRRWDFLFESAGPGCSYVFTKDLMQQVQGFVREFQLKVQRVWFHDWFCYAFARSRGFAWHIDPMPGLLYRQHQANQFGANCGLKAFLLRGRQILNGRGLAQSALIAELVGDNGANFFTNWPEMTKSKFLRMAFSAGQCRRKLSERFYFVVANLLLVIFYRVRCEDD